jgi:hypothetical protein
VIGRLFQVSSHQFGTLVQVRRQQNRRQLELAVGHHHPQSAHPGGGAGDDADLAR